jgi:hypothetical protein
MAGGTMEILICRIECLEDKLSVGWVDAKLFPDPLELVKGFSSEVFPLHRFFRAYTWPGSPTPAIRSCKSTFGISKEIPEMLSGSEITHSVISVDIPHKLTKEITNREFTESESGKSVTEIDFDSLAEHLLISQIVSADYFYSVLEDFICNLNILKIKRQTRHRLTVWVL